MVRRANPPAISTNNPIWGEVLPLPENRSAVSAAKRLGKTLTGPMPLVLHGGTGVGKSAIVQQLVRTVIESPGALTVQVLAANEFPKITPDDDPTRDLLDLDLLVIEDLHHLAERNIAPVIRLLDFRTARKRPTVFTSILSPATLVQLPRRFTSRLAAGLVVRINAPGLASRLALTEHLAERKKVPLAADAMEWIASQTTDGIRSIHGLIEKLRPLAKRYPKGISKVQALAWLDEADSGMKTRRPSALERIVQKVCAAYRVKARDLIGASRLRTIMLPRQVAMYLANKVARVPLARIGTHFGGRDHTTVMHAVRKVEATMKADVELAKIINELKAEVI